MRPEITVILDLELVLFTNSHYLFILHSPDTKGITTFKKTHVNCLNSVPSLLWEDPLVI